MKKTGNKYKNRLILLFTVLLPLARTLVVYPLMSIAQANSLELLYQLLYYLSQLVTTLSFFAVLSAATVFLFAKDGRCFFNTVAWQLLSLVIIGFILQTAVLFLLAFLDDVFAVKGFYLCNFTLSQLESADILAATLIYLFINILMIVLIMAISLGLSYMQAKKAYASAGKGSVRFSPSAILEMHTSERKNPLRNAVNSCAVVYLAASLIQAAVETIRTVISGGAPKSLSDTVTLVSPYLTIVIFTLCGYFFMQYCVKFTVSAMQKDSSAIG